MRKEEELLVALRRVIRAVDLRSKQLSKHVGLTGPQLLVMQNIQEQPGIMVREIAENINPFDYNSDIYTDIMKTQALRQALDKFKFDFSFGGARRDEEKSRAKERIFSVRNSKHNWDPKDQRPEVWNLYNFRARVSRLISYLLFQRCNDFRDRAGLLNSYLFFFSKKTSDDLLACRCPG